MEGFFDGRGFVLPGGLLFQNSFQSFPIQQIHSFKFALIKHRPVIENTRQVLCFFQGIHLNQGTGNMICFAMLLDCCNCLSHIRALHIIINGQLLACNLLLFRIGSEFRRCSVKRKSQKLISVRGGINPFKTEFFGKLLIGKPGLLFVCSQHTNP